ncbi:MAG: DNA-binding response regulator [Sphingomonadales bacterium 32-68-7]|nr:MAG: DNA-binding response regulator [Sphingomonadales bacterium 12-68-11]OYX08750.1 MAG: DNA-binding response regulator [Sphingomonadales bacterium 32-68-7]
MTRMPGHTDTVLVIDDEPASLGVMTDKLEGADIAVLVATSGEAALELLDRILPDLIIVDAVMPGIDGFETTVRIKRNPRLANIPIIFLTGLSESEHVVEAFEVGGVDYIRKPVNLNELLARVRVHMAQGRAAHASAASLDATGRMMLATDASGSMLWCTPRAEAAISRLTPGWSRQDSELPAMLRTPVERLLSNGTAGASVRVEQSPAEDMLELVLVTHHRAHEVLIRLNELNPRKDVEKLAATLRLTQREAEVLLWVSYGKSNGDISDVLDISPRTVQKHLEHVYEKLGVETRSAAAAIAIRSIER